MIIVAVILLLVIIFQFFYIRNLRKEICVPRNTWVNIEEITDHNKDGDVVIHCRRTEDK